MHTPLYLIKADVNGDTLWTRAYGTDNAEYGYSISQTSVSGFIVCGSSHVSSNNDDVFLIKTDASGTLLWTKTYGGATSDMGSFVMQSSDGGYALTGFTYSFGVPGEGNGFVVFNGASYIGTGSNNPSSLIKMDYNGNTKCPNSYIPFTIGRPPTQVTGSNWSISSVGTEKRIPTIVKDTLVADSLFCEQCGTNNISFDGTICKGEKDTILVASIVNSSYLWEPSDFLTCTDCPSPLASPDSSIFYFLTSTDDNGCISYDSIFIKVDSCKTDLFIPNIFSPDGNGMNDQWVIKGMGNQGWRLQIFNRWGELMYQTDKPAEKYWDSRTFSGMQLNSGVFFISLITMS